MFVNKRAPHSNVEKNQETIKKLRDGHESCKRSRKALKEALLMRGVHEVIMVSDRMSCLWEKKQRKFSY